MPADLPMQFAVVPLACFIALPALATWRRRILSRETSAVALELAAFAAAVRVADRSLPLDDSLRARIRRLRLPDSAPLDLAQQLHLADPLVLADAAQRLALRLRRRVAFDRKMLARTAPGLRRGAVAACLPPLLMAALQWFGTQIPGIAQLVLLGVEAGACALLWRLAHVEI